MYLFNINNLKAYNSIKLLLLVKLKSLLRADTVTKCIHENLSSYCAQ